MTLFNIYMYFIRIIDNYESISRKTEKTINEYIKLAEKLNDKHILLLLHSIKEASCEKLTKSEKYLIRQKMIWKGFCLWPGLSRLNHRDISYLDLYGCLVDPDYDVNANIDSAANILHCFARHGSVHHLKCLINRGADVNQRQLTSGMTPLMMVARFGDYNMVKCLLDNGADPTCTSNIEGTSALYCAMVHSSEMTFELLCDSLYDKDKDADLAKHLQLEDWQRSFSYTSGPRLDKDRLRVLMSWRKYWKKTGNSDNCSTLIPFVEYLHDEQHAYFRVFIVKAIQGNFLKMVKMMLRVQRRQNKQDHLYLTALVITAAVLCGSQKVLQECQLSGTFSSWLW